jgi:hypothetical protein
MNYLTQQLKQATAQIMNIAGGPLSVVFVTKGTYVPGVSTTNTETKIAGRGAWMDHQEKWSEATFDGTLILRGDKILYLEPSSAFPRHPTPDKDFVEDASGARWKIIGKRDNNPSGEAPICYFLLMRK